MVIYRLREIRLLCICFVLCARLAWADQPCSSDCRDLIDQSEKLEKSIQRLMTIKATNIEFLRTLDASQESQRLKANSNIRIAEKRIAEAQDKQKDFKREKTVKGCNGCAES